MYVYDIQYNLLIVYFKLWNQLNINMQYHGRWRQNELYALFSWDISVSAL